MAQALAKFQALGFRVIEGGMGNKVALLKTPGIAEMTKLRHDNVLRDIRQYQESLPSNLRTIFAEHCRPSTYAGKRGSEPCFELTKVGFLAIAPKYDPPLGLLLAVAFEALETGNAAAQASTIRQINDRVRELRLKASDQVEIAFDADDSDHDEDDATARTIWARGAEPQQPARWLDETRWTEHQDGFEFQATLRYDSHNKPNVLYVTFPGTRPHPRMPRHLIGEGDQFYLIHDPTVPTSVILSALGRMPNPPVTPIVLKTVEHLLAT